MTIKADEKAKQSAQQNSRAEGATSSAGDSTLPPPRVQLAAKLLHMVTTESEEGVGKDGSPDRWLVVLKEGEFESLDKGALDLLKEMLKVSGFECAYSERDSGLWRQAPVSPLEYEIVIRPVQQTGSPSISAGASPKTLFMPARTATLQECYVSIAHVVSLFTAAPMVCIELNTGKSLAIDSTRPRRKQRGPGSCSTKRCTNCPLPASWRPIRARLAAAAFGGRAERAAAPQLFPSLQSDSSSVDAQSTGDQQSSRKRTLRYLDDPPEPPKKAKQ